MLTPGEADEVLGMLRAMVAARRAHRADDHAQVPRGDGVRRRGHGPAPRQAGRRAAASPTSTPDAMAGDDDRRRSELTKRSRARSRRVGAAAARASTSLERARRCRRSRRCTTSRLTSRAARSSASPASPATASASWSRCSPASATPSGGEIRVAGERYHADAARRCAATSCRCLPEEPLQERLRRRA